MGIDIKRDWRKLPNIYIYIYKFNKFLHLGKGEKALYYYTPLRVKKWLNII